MKRVVEDFQGIKEQSLYSALYIVPTYSHKGRFPCPKPMLIV